VVAALVLAYEDYTFDLHLYSPCMVVFKLGVSDYKAVWGFELGANLIEVILGELSRSSICPLFENTLTFEDDTLCACSLIADFLI
jgi:hypothetical protein